MATKTAEKFPAHVEDAVRTELHRAYGKTFSGSISRRALLDRVAAHINDGADEDIMCNNYTRSEYNFVAYFNAALDHEIYNGLRREMTADELQYLRDEYESLNDDEDPEIDWA
jgi:hypothetical protein